MFPNANNPPWGPNPPRAPGGPDWLWFSTAGALALVVVVLLYVAVWRGRSRGRLRCPKCWYDMAGAEAIGDRSSATGAEFPLTCPECGKRITKPRKLRKTRVRWRLVAVCAALALLATASGPLPKVRTHGPLSVMPTWVLILLIEYEPILTETFDAWRIAQHPAGPASEASVRELFRRDAFATMSRSQWREYLIRTHALLPDSAYFNDQSQTIAAYDTWTYFPCPREYRLDVYAIERNGELISEPGQVHPHLPIGDFDGSVLLSITNMPFFSITGAGGPIPWHGGGKTGMHVALQLPMQTRSLTVLVTAQYDPWRNPHSPPPRKPIDLGEMKIQIRPELLDAALWRERFPEACTNE